MNSGLCISGGARVRSVILSNSRSGIKKHEPEKIKVDPTVVELNSIPNCHRAESRVTEFWMVLAQVKIDIVLMLRSLEQHLDTPHLCILVHHTLYLVEMKGEETM